MMRPRDRLLLFKKSFNYERFGDFLYTIRASSSPMRDVFSFTELNAPGNDTSRASCSRPGPGTRSGTKSGTRSGTRPHTEPLTRPRRRCSDGESPETALPGLRGLRGSRELRPWFIMELMEQVAGSDSASEFAASFEASRISLPHESVRQSAASTRYASSFHILGGEKSEPPDDHSGPVVKPTPDLLGPVTLLTLRRGTYSEGFSPYNRVGKDWSLKVNSEKAAQPLHYPCVEGWDEHSLAHIPAARENEETAQ